MALRNKRAGAGTKVLIGPGAYRERIDLTAAGGESDAPIIFQAQTAGTVAISGSDIWTGWQSRSGGAYTHAWSYHWGLASYPAGWQGNVVLADIVRRREMLFVNSVPATQVLSSSALVPGSFYIDEGSGLVYLLPAAGVDPNAATVEVSTRSNLLYVFGLRNIVLRGITFRHETSFIQNGGPMQIVNSSNILVENCQVLWNSTGPAVTSSDHVTMRSLIASNNAFSGFGVYRVSQSLFVDNETSLNNWRGFAGGYTEWAVAGAKFMLLHHSVIQGHKATSNFTRGLWLDTDVSDVLVQGGSWTNNLLDGVFVEAIQGPVAIASSVNANNGGAGLLMGDCAAMSLTSSVLYGNKLGQILISGQPGGRYVQDFETGAVHQGVVTSGLHLSDNIVSSGSGAQDAVATTLNAGDWGAVVAGLSSSRNIWFNPARVNVFQVAGGGRLALSQWQSSTGQDLTSTFVNPCFSNPDQNDFTRTACRPVGPPVLRPTGGTFASTMSVTLSSDSPGAAIRYTLNGTAPDSSSPLYSTPIQLTSTATVVAAAFYSEAAGPTASGSYVMTSSIAQVSAATWGYMVNCQSQNGNLTKTSGINGAADSGAVSTQQVDSAGGYLEVTATELGTLRWIGLGSGTASTVPEDIPFGLAFWGTAAQVRETNVVRAQTTFQPGDVFRVTLNAGTVQYSKNGQVFYTSLGTATGSYNIRVILLSSGASVSNVVLQPPSVLSGATPQPVAWSNVTNATVNGSSISKTLGSNEAADAGAVSLQTAFGTDASLSLTVAETSTIRWIGFGQDGTGTEPERILFGFCLWGGNLQVREGNVQRVQVPLKIGDELKIVRSSASATYYQNGNVLYTSTMPAPNQLKVRVSFLSLGASIANVYFSTGI